MTNLIKKTPCEHDEATICSCGDPICDECGTLFNHNKVEEALCEECYDDVIECIDCDDWTFKMCGWPTGSGDEDGRCPDCVEAHEEEKAQKEQEFDILVAAIEHLYERGLINKEDTDDYGKTMEDQIWENYKTNGGSSRSLHAGLEDYELQQILEHIGNANYRHTATHYDNIDKRGMSEEQINELRREFTIR